jgi:6-phosphogluconolactonase (cycloisomerase 2 family)
MSRTLASAWRGALMWLCALSLAACSGGVSSTDTSASVTASQFTVGVTVTGLSGSNLVLQNNGGDNLSIPADGSFTFATPLVRGDSYSVTVWSEPGAPAQTCVVTNGSGTVGTANVTGIAVACADKTTTTDTIGGTAVGVLGAGLVLQDNAGDNLALSANGPFTFATALASGAAYSVTVLSPPINPYQDCAITNGTGTTGSANVTNVAVSCKTNPNPTFTIGGSVSGISGAGSLVLQDNGRDNLTVTADGPFQFAIPIPSGSPYNVTSLQVSGQQSQTCTFANASGIVAASNVTNVSVVCKANAPVSVTVSGLAGSGLVLQDNGGDNLAIAQNGAATFATALASGTAYNVTVLTQPSAPTQNCVVTNGTGTAVAGQATPVKVACTTIGYSVGGTISNLSGAGLVLQDNGGDNLSVAGTGASVPFVFNTPIPSGGQYNVTVLTQPGSAGSPYQTCTVNNPTGSGVVQSSNVTSVQITCTTNTFTVGGTVIGLPVNPASGLLTAGLSLELNGGAAYAVTVTPFTLPGAVASGLPYSVAITAQPAGYACAVTNGSNVIVDTAVTNVLVSCSEIGGYLYVTNGGGNNISGFAIDYNSGALEPLTQIVAPAGQPNAIVATTDTHPSSIIGGCYLAYSTAGADYPIGVYVANSVSGTVGAYSLNTSTTTAAGGSLSLITTPSIAAGTAPSYLDFNNCVAYALNSGSSNISAFSASATTGALSALLGSPFATPAAGSVPTAAANATGVGPNEKSFQYVASQVSNDVTAYVINTDGTLTLATSPVPPSVNPIAAGTNPSAVATIGLAVATEGFASPFVYVANQGDNDIDVYQGDPNSGVLAALGTPVGTGVGPTSIAVVVGPALLYVANGTDNTISAYSINTAVTGTGTLTPLGITVPTGTHPVALGLATVNVSTYLYAVNGQSNDIYVYLVTTSVGGVPALGSLTLVGKFAVGTAPTSVSIPFSESGG